MLFVVEVHQCLFVFLIIFLNRPLMSLLHAICSEKMTPCIIQSGDSLCSLAV